MQSYCNTEESLKACTMPRTMQEYHHKILSFYFTISFPTKKKKKNIFTAHCENATVATLYSALDKEQQQKQSSVKKKLIRIS